MQKYEREIEELLEKLESQETQAPRPVRRDRPPNLPRRRSSTGSSLQQVLRAIRVTPSQFVVAGLALVILSWIIPSGIASGGLKEWVAIIGVLLFLSAIVSSLFVRNRTNRPEKLWRGRSLEPEDKSWSDIRSQVGNAARDFRRRFRRRY